MTASADISTRTRDDVVGVPIQSVAVRTIDQLTLEGEEVADAEKRFTADADGFVEIVFAVAEEQVETGIQSNEMIEIVSGIEDGEKVVVGSYRAISSDLKNGTQVAINNDTDGRTDSV
jgi:HlyD family secretion protein